MKGIKIWCNNGCERSNVFIKLNEKHMLNRHFVNRLYASPMGFMIDEYGNVTQTRSDLIFKMNKGKKLYAMDYICNAKPGDMVKITDLSHGYDAYSEWWALNEYKELYKPFKSAELNRKYKLIKIEKGMNHSWSTTLLALIQDTETKQVFIIDINVIEKVNEV